MELKFYKCKHCGNIIAVVKASGAPISCCGEKMTEIVPGTADAAVEKHVPVVEIKDGKVIVTVGEVAHPMAPEHYIEWIAISTDQGNQRKILEPGDKPMACFALCDGEKFEAAYAYCNLHGLWKK
ncbi:desulfoferrodoxin family protein [uncultured Ruminococcus sp.]|jgi:superoxide reductase|uniref:desulfoferrodoxin family protein n=1 Tax=uncultured Ruminococcus sp. TaxID=165186 RepID=UPI0037DD7D86